MLAPNGKLRKTTASNIEGILRIIQPIPSKKAEPFKQWLALVGKERLDEIADPELAFERMIKTYRQKGWSGKSVKEYKAYKGLHKENLRDNMTNIELALNQLAEVSATAISQATNPKGFSETKNTVVEGGAIAGNARKELEDKIGRSVISPLNAQSLNLLDEAGEA